MAGPEKPLLEVKNLKLTRRDRPDLPPLVDDLSLALGKGENVGLVGESGSGKTLTCLSLLQLLPPSVAMTSGSLAWHPPDGPSREVSDDDPGAWARLRGGQIGMIFQHALAALNPVLRCGDQLGEAVRKGHPEAADWRPLAIEWLQRVQLAEPERMFAAYPWQLSGGQRQRILIAMALAARPRLVIADEPTSALDVITQRAILDLLVALRAASPMSFLFVSHDLALIEEMADRVMVMRRGEIVEEGEVAQVMGAPRHPYTRALLACRPSLGRRRRRLPVMEDFLPGPDEEKPVEPGAGPDHDGPSPFLSDREIRERREQRYGKPPYVQVQDLCVEYASRHAARPAHPAVRSVSFALHRGEILGLVGATGSGKTSVGKALLGLLPGTSGRIVREGENLLDRSGEQWRHLRRSWQILFQDSSTNLNPRFTVGRILLEPLHYHRICPDRESARAAVVKALEEVKLDPAFADKRPHQLSGGERQRVALARALTVQPELLVCDEPVSALDVSVQAEILNLILDLNEARNLTCLFITHDIAVIHAVADRLLVMEEGRIVESGLVPDLLLAPKHPYTQRLLRALPALG